MTNAISRPLIYWAFDDALGTIASGSSTVPAAGTSFFVSGNTSASGASIVSDGRFGNALQIVAGSLDLTAAAGHEFSANNHGFLIDFWLKLSGNDNARIEMLKTGEGLVLEVAADSTVLIVDLDFDGVSTRTLTGIVPRDNQWHHIRMSIEKGDAAPSNALILTVDGLEHDLDTDPAGEQWTLFGVFAVGGSMVLSSTGTAFFDEVAFFDAIHNSDFDRPIVQNDWSESRMLPTQTATPLYLYGFAVDPTGAVVSGSSSNPLDDRAHPNGAQSGNETVTGSVRFSAAGTGVFGGSDKLLQVDTGGIITMPERAASVPQLDFSNNVFGFTFDFWYQQGPTTGSPDLFEIDFFDNTPSFPSKLLFTFDPDTDELTIDVAFLGSGGTQIVTYGPIVAIKDGDFHHVRFSITNTSTAVIVISVDGISHVGGFGPVDEEATILRGTTDITLRAIQTGTNPSPSPEIDELAFFDAYHLPLDFPVPTTKGVYTDTGLQDAAPALVAEFDIGDPQPRINWQFNDATGVLGFDVDELLPVEITRNVPSGTSDASGITVASIVTDAKFTKALELTGTGGITLLRPDQFINLTEFENGVSIDFWLKTSGTGNVVTIALTSATSGFGSLQLRLPASSTTITATLSDVFNGSGAPTTNTTFPRDEQFHHVRVSIRQSDPVIIALSVDGSTPSFVSGVPGHTHTLFTFTDIGISFTQTPGGDTAVIDNFAIFDAFHNSAFTPPTSETEWGLTGLTDGVVQSTVLSELSEDDLISELVSEGTLDAAEAVSNAADNALLVTNGVANDSATGIFALTKTSLGAIRYLDPIAAKIKDAVADVWHTHTDKSDLQFVSEAMKSTLRAVVSGSDHVLREIIKKIEPFVDVWHKHTDDTPISSFGSITIPDDAPAGTTQPIERVIDGLNAEFAEFWHSHPAAQPLPVLPAYYYSFNDAVGAITSGSDTDPDEITGNLLDGNFRMLPSGAFSATGKFGNSITLDPNTDSSDFFLFPKENSPATEDNFIDLTGFDSGFLLDFWLNIPDGVAVVSMAFDADLIGNVDAADNRGISVSIDANNAITLLLSHGVGGLPIPIGGSVSVISDPNIFVRQIGLFHHMRIVVTKTNPVIAKFYLSGIKLLTVTAPLNDIWAYFSHLKLPRTLALKNVALTGSAVAIDSLAIFDGDSADAFAPPIAADNWDNTGIIRPSA